MFGGVLENISLENVLQIIIKTSVVKFIFIKIPSFHLIILDIQRTSR